MTQTIVLFNLGKTHRTCFFTSDYFLKSEKIRGVFFSNELIENQSPSTELLKIKFYILKRKKQVKIINTSVFLSEK